MRSRRGERVLGVGAWARASAECTPRFSEIETDASVSRSVNPRPGQVRRGVSLSRPFGAAIALVGLAAGAHALLCLLRGRSFVDALVRLPFWRIVLALFVLLWAAWGYKYLVWEDATAR